MYKLALDETDKRLLKALAGNGRASAAALAQVVGLTRQAVSDRMEKLRSEGLIEGFTLSLNPEKLGLEMRAFIAIILLPGVQESEEAVVIELLRRSPWVQECYRVAGEDYFQARVIAPNIKALRELVVELRATGFVQGTRTTMALETMFEKSAMSFPGCRDEDGPE